ncbi:Zinc finger protein DZIP1L [Echinococcus granulosus]|nr:Zinc finger protein DZIP1L [Echinococcus granulosus]
MMAFNPNLPGQVPFRASKMPGFFFRKRVERIDWKRLASVDVCRVASQMDIDALQDNLVSVAFCDINSEIDTRYVDTNFIKLFQLAQLLIEYLLYSQDYLTNTVDSLRLENETIKKETDALKKRLEQQAQRLTSTRKECHRRRLLLLAQQRLMNSGPQSYHRCPHCTKAFINASFLNAHLFRRHSEVISALQDIDLNHASLLPLDSGTSFIVEKGTNGKPPVLAPNLEQQIQEVLDHLKSQIPPPPPPPLPLTSAVVQTIEAKGAASPRASAAVEAAWRQRAAELERQLEEERDHLRQLEERNRAWQESVASQYRTDVERVKEMFEVELRNLREENLETQRELIQLRIKKANVSNFEDVEADIPEQLERQVRSLEEVRSPMPKMVTVSPPKHSSEKVRSLPSSSDSPMTKVVRNTNNAAHSVRSSCSMISRGVSCSDKIGSLDHMLHAISNVPKKRSRHQQTSDRESLSLANASIQVAPNEVTSRLVTRTLTSPQKQQALLTNRGVVVESLIVRTEDEEDGESDRTRSIHLIPFAVSTPSFLRTVLNEAPPKREGYRPYNEAELGNNKIVQLADDSSNKSEYAKERVSKSRPTTQPNAEKSHNPLQANGSELRVDPLEGISHYKDQLEEFRSDPDAMKRLRKEVESLLVEQLIDHDVDGDAVGLTRGKFTETLDTLGQERQHLTRKHPNFAEIRASIARKVDRMALIALHSKRGRHDSALRGGSNGFGGGDGDVDGEGLQKKPRASRIADRDALSRPPSGRPASLTSLTHTLSPIVEYRRFATASPALRKTNPTQSKQSLFENTEDEGDDGDGRVVKVEGRTAVYRTAKKFHQSMNEEVDDRFQSKNQSPGHSVKFSDENEPRKNNNPDEDDDDDGPVSVFSILSEEQGDIGLSPMRPETRRGERADPVASSVTTLSPLRPGASYTISTSQWDTSSQVNDNQRFGRGEPDDRLDSDA